MSSGTRLVEYIALYEPDASRFLRTGTEAPSGVDFLLHEDANIPVKVTAKFPETDHKDVAFPPALELFIFPNGAHLKTYRPHTSSHTFVCTLVDGKRLYAYCMIEWKPSAHLSFVKLQMGARLMNDADARFQPALSLSNCATLSAKLFSQVTL